MEQYISKSALVAEINKRIMDAPIDCYGHQRVWAYNDIKDIINTLEMKEVDLEEEIQRQYSVHKNPDNSMVKDCVIMTKDGFEYFAKHFFELGLKAQKGEEA